MDRFRYDRRVDMAFHKTKSGVAICPFFIWKSENIEGLGQHEENDVSLTICNHSENNVPYEGNCQENLCPLLKQNKNLNKKGTETCQSTTSTNKVIMSRNRT